MSFLKFFYLSLMILLIGSSLSLNLAVASEDVASSTIEGAEAAMVSAYEAVLDAEKAGGNISSLLTQLNEAGDFLAVARMSYRNEDFDNAIYFGNLSKNVGEEVRNSANELKDLAWNEGLQHMWFTVLGSVSGIILVVLGSLWVWRFLKRRYQ